MYIMEVSRSAVAHWAPQHRGAGKMQFSCSQDNCPVKWAVHIFIRFSKEDSQKRTLLWQIPCLRHSRRLWGGDVWSWLRHYGSGRACANVSALFLEEKSIFQPRQLAISCCTKSGNRAAIFPFPLSISRNVDKDRRRTCSKGGPPNVHDYS